MDETRVITPFNTEKTHLSCQAIEITFPPDHFSRMVEVLTLGNKLDDTDVNDDTTGVKSVMIYGLKISCREET